MHHLRRLRIRVPSGDTAFAANRRPAARRGEHRKWENEYGSKLFRNLERNGNALGFAPSERQKFIEKNELPYFDGIQEYCLWLGCMGSYDPQGREIVLALARVLRHAGVTFGVLRKEKGTGDPARRLGNDLAAAQAAEANIETLRAANVARHGSPSARTACAPLAPTGANTEPRSKSSITANCWRGWEPGCRLRKLRRQCRISRSLLPGPVPQRL